MNTNADISHVTYIPACYCTDGRARVLVDGGGVYRDAWKVAPESIKPVYVRIGGRVREAKRWLWLWRLVAEVQRWMD